MEVSELLTWVVADDKDVCMEKRSLLHSPALLKLVDEILVNAADNRHRKKGMTYIDINAVYKKGQLKVSIENDGASIPIEMHPKENMYVPQLVFGNLLTGSNFDDNKASVGGGRHGYGAKLTNIFSRSFEVQICNMKTKQLYTQDWKDNMSVVSEAVISATTKQKSDFTKISFAPDLKRFNLSSKEIEAAVIENTILLIRRRAFDIASCVGSKIAVTFNAKRVPISSFKEYMGLFPAVVEDVTDADEVEACSRVFRTQVSARWELGLKRVAASDHMSFVNALWTSRGGSHVQAVVNQVTKYLEEAVQTGLSKGKKSEAKTYSSSSVLTAIRSKLFVFLNCLIENPTFDSQGKDFLTTKQASFGSEAIVKESFLKDFATNSGIVEAVLEEFKMKERSQLIRAARSSKASKMVNIPKLEDAHKVGTLDCSLILTEGDSAKALAVAGLEVIGRDKYGRPS
jgi:DNA topoisomerase-2